VRAFPSRAVLRPAERSSRQTPRPMRIAFACAQVHD